MLFREQIVVRVVIDTQHLLSELHPGQPNERKTVDFLLISEYSTHWQNIQHITECNRTVSEIKHLLISPLYLQLQF